MQPIKLATSHLLKCKVLYTTSGNRLIIISLPLPLLLFALFLYSSKVNPQPSCETQLTDLYSNLFLVTLLVLRGIKCCKLPLDFLFCFFYKVDSFFCVEVMFKNETPALSPFLLFSLISLYHKSEAHYKSLFRIHSDLSYKLFSSPDLSDFTSRR